MRSEGTGVRGRRGSVAALVAAAVVLVGAAAPARAMSSDIPDLALVTANGSGRTTALRSGDRDFALLWQLLSPTETSTEPVPDGWRRGHLPQVRASVVWALTGIGGWPYTRRAPGGDVAVERRDEVFLAADGTPWVRSAPAPDFSGAGVRWHRGPRPVFDRLEKEGLLGGPAAPAGDGSSGGLRWGAAGLAAGLALGVGGSWAGRRAAARRQGEPREPRHELIDL
ncbi:hypothetical protein ACIHAA_19805 [Streptomyces sp. NPDC052040]|uniref:hypothetical protein n=1 Tax=Streptomyces sp. NPDC052040 TaxID=3365682 RepID=UPI0037D1FD59